MAKAQIKRDMNPAAGPQIGQNGPNLVAEKAEIGGIAQKNGFLRKHLLTFAWVSGFPVASNGQ